MLKLVKIHHIDLASRYEFPEIDRNHSLHRSCDRLQRNVAYIIFHVGN
jgi:hypothetical protein